MPKLVDNNQTIYNYDSNFSIPQISRQLQPNLDKIVSLNTDNSSNFLKNIGRFFSSFVQRLFKCICCCFVSTSNKNIPQALIQYFKNQRNSTWSDDQVLSETKKQIACWEETQNVVLIACQDQEQTDEILLWVANRFPNLQNLHLTNSNFSKKGIDAIAENCLNIKELQLAHTNIDDEGLIKLISTSNEITYLTLSHTNLTDQSLLEIARNCSKLTNLYVANTQITDLGASAVAQACPNLSYFDLRDTETGDQTLEQVGQSCPELSSISIGVNATDTGLLALVKQEKAHFDTLYLNEKISLDALKKFVEKTQTSIQWIGRTRICFQEHYEQSEIELKKIKPSLYCLY